MKQALHSGPTIIKSPVHPTVTRRFLLGACETIRAFVCATKNYNNYAENIRRYRKKDSVGHATWHPGYVHPW
jgi:hypothetical protein